MTAMQTNQATEQRTLHIRFEGRSLRIPLATLNLGEQASEQQFIAATARYLDVAPQRFGAYVVERQPNGNVTIRPEAVFG